MYTYIWTLEIVFIKRLTPFRRPLVKLVENVALQISWSVPNAFLRRCRAQHLLIMAFGHTDRVEPTQVQANWEIVVSSADGLVSSSIAACLFASLMMIIISFET